MKSQQRSKIAQFESPAYTTKTLLQLVLKERLFSFDAAARFEKPGRLKGEKSASWPTRRNHHQGMR